MKEIIEELKDENSKYVDSSLFNITSFGTDMSFREILMMNDEGDLEKPELQRNYIWTKKEASRFIDSILLGLPVPSIFLAKEKNNKMIIVDGLQRITTVCDYINGIFTGDGKLFKLSKTEDIYSEWRGKAFNELEDKYKRAIRTYTIHAIVFEQKYPEDDTGMYQIFERINTGGRILKPQEIRNCIYHGKFNQVLSELNKEQVWRKILNSQKLDARMSDVELILRFFAIHNLYNRPERNQNQINLTKYLNDFMFSKESISDCEINVFSKMFLEVMEFLFSMENNKIFRALKISKNGNKWAPKINPVFFDSISCATANAFSKKAIKYQNNDEFHEKYISLITNTEYLNLTKQRTTDVKNIFKRINIASMTLYGIQYE